MKMREIDRQKKEKYIETGLERERKTVERNSLRERRRTKRLISR